MQIHQLMTNPGNDVWYTDSFRNVLENHLTYFRSSPSLKQLVINNHLAYKYEGDLFGLMDELNIDKNYHYIIMLINNINSPADYKPERNLLLIPDISELNMIKNIHTSKKTTV